MKRLNQKSMLKSVAAISLLLMSGAPLFSGMTANAAEPDTEVGEPVVLTEVSLPENSGKIAFIRSENEMSQQEQAAYDFFTSELNNHNIILTSETDKIKSPDFDCIWIHIDRKGLQQGASNLPGEFITSEMAHSLRQYVEEGGNLYLSGQATQMLETIGRIESAYSPNEYNAGDGNYGNDEWTINPWLIEGKYDRTGHALFADLEKSHAYTWTTYGMLYGGGDEIHREDHNCMWKLSDFTYNYDGGDNMINFEKENGARILATWGHEQTAGWAGIIEFYPTKVSEDKWSGSILANGMAACQWHTEGVNTDEENLMHLTANAFSYLANKDGKKPENPHVTITIPDVPEPEITYANLLEHLKDYENANAEICLIYDTHLEVVKDEEGNVLKDENNKNIQVEKIDIGKQAEGAMLYFIEKYCKGDNPKGGLLPSTKMRELDPKTTKCVWVNIDRVELENMEGWSNLPEGYSSVVFIDALKNYMQSGGNVYLSGQAVELLSTIWRVSESEKANQWDHDGTGEAVDGTWGIYTPYKTGENKDELHPIFKDLSALDGTTDRFGILDVPGDARYENHNTIWKLSNIEFLYKEGSTDIENFEKDNLATVLAHFNWNNAVDEKDYVGLVEFHPIYSWDKETQSRTRQSGAIIANGFASMQWRYFTNDERTEETAATDNKYRTNLETLTSNILNYLSDGNHIVKEGEHPYNRPNNLTVEETLETTGLIAMYIGYDSEEKLRESNNFQEYKAYTYFRDNFIDNPIFETPEYKAKYGGRGPQVLWKGDKDKIKFCGQEEKVKEGEDNNLEGFECVWVNIAGVRADEIVDGKEEGHVYSSDDLLTIFDGKESYNQLIANLKNFRAAGGNIYTTKFANLMLNDIDENILTPNQVSKEAKDEASKWWINLNPNNGIYDQSSHPIFSTMEVQTLEDIINNIYDYGSGILLFDGDGDHLDANCVWWLDDEHFGVNHENCNDNPNECWNYSSCEERIQKFNTQCNATVLGTWGHAEDYAYYTAAMVEFHPNKSQANMPERMTPQQTVASRRGTIIANGPGAYEWDTNRNAAHDDTNMQQLTSNTLAYLTPVMGETFYTEVELIREDENDSDAKAVYFNLQGMQVAEPTDGIYIEVKGNKSRKIFVR